jgi:TatD DNase family protein
MKIIDTHCHLNFKDFKEDSFSLIEECLKIGIGLLLPGAEFSTSQRALKIAEKFQEGVWAAAGLHPLHLTSFKVVEKEIDPNLEFETAGEVFDLERYRRLALSSKKIVALGEIGLDYYYLPKNKQEREKQKQEQKRVFIEQLKLAKELNLPIILHSRVSHQDIIPLLSDFKVAGVAHGFVGKISELEQYLKIGFYIGFNGIIFKKIQGVDFKEIIEKTPLERILLETDSPYLSPPPYLKERNTPLNIIYIASFVAQIKKIPLDLLFKKTLENAQQLFRI